MYVDIRQTFSLWFLPMYHAHVRLVTVLDLVASDDADFHDPLDRIIQQDKEGDDKSTSQLQQHSHNGDEPRRYKIRRQEDLYQVNDYLKFLGGPGPLPFLWFLFQLQATALCVFMSMFVRLSPWAFQPEPAKGGVEATIERVESYHDNTSEQAEEESPRSHEEGKSKDKKLEESPPITRGTQDHPENKNGGENRGGSESPNTVKATNGRNNGNNGNNGKSGKNGHNGQHQDDAQHSEQRPNTQEHDTKNGGNNNGGERRDSANSKASPIQSRKKGKKGGNR